MTLSREEVQHVARLARIGLTEEEEAKFQKDLASIFGLIEELQEAKVGDTILLATAQEKNRTRQDVVSVKDDPKAIVKSFPGAKDGYNKVRSVF